MECVIVSYRSAGDLRGFASELAEDAFSRVLVVDNASPDDSAQAARSCGFGVLQRPRNDGFGPAANDGIGQTDGDLVVLLNPDVHVHDAGLIRSLAAQFSDERVGLAAPALILPDGSVQDSARSVPTPWDLVQRRRTGRDVGAVRTNDPRDVSWVVGAFMMMRRTAFEEVGGFDPRFFLYFEDVDLCVRLRHAGWTIRYDPTTAAGHHHQAASRAGFAQWSTRQHILSAARFYARHPRAIVGGEEATAGAGSVGSRTARPFAPPGTGDQGPIRIALVVSFLNEAAYLPHLLNSLETQTEPADEVLLIDDGSTDMSAEIADAFAARYPTVTVERRPMRRRETDRLAQAPELHSFVWGVERLGDGWDVVTKLDADLILPPTLLAEVRSRFAADPSLGLTGSFLSVRNASGALVRASIPAYHVHGATKFYRRECFEEVYPLPSVLGWDTIDDLRARRAGWTTRSFRATSGDAVHLRPSGLHDGRLRAYRRWGRCAWGYGAHPAVIVVGAARRMMQPPYVMGGLNYLWGWMLAGLHRESRAEPELVAFAHAEDVRRLRAATRFALSRILGGGGARPVR